MRSPREWLALLILPFLPAQVPAADPPVFAAPDIRPGDSWTFSYTRESNGTSGRWSRTVMDALANGRLEVRVGNGSLHFYDARMNYVGTTPDGDPEELARFPMKVGDSWDYSRRFPNPHSEGRGSSKVVSYEKVSVPAGTFDCFRVESRTTNANQLGSNDIRRIRWYCPEIKWIAKEQYESQTTKKYELNTKVVQTSELQRYMPAH